LLLPAHDQPLIAGILHPQALQSLFVPQARSFVYLQPVRRPLDGRHGNQPYRLARHLQVVALLRPAPENLLHGFLASLRRLGIALEHHDLRFTEGRWSLPAIGAWGLGWNARLNGVGVARVTLIQEAAGRHPQPIAAEIAYGLERLVACVTSVRSAYDVAWSAGGPSYGALRRADEEALSRHAFDVADPEQLRARLAHDASEARMCLEAGVPTGALAAAVHSLYLLDLLAARRALGADERAAVEARIATTIRAVADAVAGSAQATPEEVADG